MEIMLCLQRNVVVYFSTHVCIMKLMCNDHKRCTSKKKKKLSALKYRLCIFIMKLSVIMKFSVDQAKVSAHKAFITEQDYSE